MATPKDAAPTTEFGRDLSEVADELSETAENVKRIALDLRSQGVLVSSPSYSSACGVLDGAWRMLNRASELLEYVAYTHEDD